MACLRSHSFPMPLPSKSHHRVLQPFFLFLICITTSLAVTQEELGNIFTLHSPTASPGGCSRTLPNGVNMLLHTVAAFTEPFTIAAAVQSQIRSLGLDTPEAKKLRNLLFLFSGITFVDENQISAEKAQDFNYVLGMEPSL